MSDRTVNGCRWCGVPRREHAQRWTEGVGWHTHVEPTDEQRKARLLAGTEAPAVCPECNGSGVVDDADNTGCYGCGQGGAHESWCGLAPCPRGCPIPVPAGTEVPR